MTINSVLEKYFKGERTIYFQTSDRLRSMEGDTYLSYDLNDGVCLYFGGNSGEVCLLHTREAEKLERVIKELIYSS